MNRERIAALITFDDEGVDTSTGYVGVGAGSELVFDDPTELTVFMKDELEKLPEVDNVLYYARQRGRTPESHKMMVYVKDGRSSVCVRIDCDTIGDFKESMKRLFFRTTIYYSDSFDGPQKSQSLFSERSLQRLKYLADNVRLI